jgi:hypothetical protein
MGASQSPEVMAMKWRSATLDPALGANHSPTLDDDKLREANRQLVCAKPCASTPQVRKSLNSCSTNPGKGDPSA